MSLFLRRPSWFSPVRSYLLICFSLKHSYNVLSTNSVLYCCWPYQILLFQEKQCVYSSLYHLQHIVQVLNYEYFYICFEPDWPTNIRNQDIICLITWVYSRFLAMRFGMGANRLEFIYFCNFPPSAGCRTQSLMHSRQTSTPELYSQPQFL